MIDKALILTEFFDFNSTEVKSFVEKASLSSDNNLDRLKSVYTVVRDSISYNPYRIPLEKEYYRSSRICRMRRAYCIPKSILFSSCARLLGFRSWIGFADVRNHLSSKRFVEYLGTDIFAFHGFSVVEINGIRIKATPVFDSRLCEKFGVKPLEFDGKTDSLFQEYDSKGNRFMEYVNERGEFDDFPFDYVMQGLRNFYPQINQQIDGDLKLEEPAS
ncbi:MAG: transglutaminase domain-containing protein [Leptonema sp. (in: Bacteria)]|nr:transglutaminase domain-containing protein [Leptonema sp. (in: bacteria)]